VIRCLRGTPGHRQDTLDQPGPPGVGEELCAVPIGAGDGRSELEDHHGSLFERERGRLYTNLRVNRFHGHVAEYTKQVIEGDRCAWLERVDPDPQRRRRRSERRAFDGERGGRELNNVAAPIVCWRVAFVEVGAEACSIPSTLAECT